MNATGGGPQGPAYCNREYARAARAIWWRRANNKVVVYITIPTFAFSREKMLLVRIIYTYVCQPFLSLMYIMSLMYLASIHFWPHLASPSCPKPPLLLLLYRKEMTPPLSPIPPSAPSTSIPSLYSSHAYPPGNTRHWSSAARSMVSSSLSFPLFLYKLYTHYG